MADGTRRTATSKAGGRWWTSRWVIALLLAVLALIFVLENRDSVSIRLLIPVVTMPQWAALGITLVIGVLIGLLARRR